jgi:hypothetical protein
MGGIMQIGRTLALGTLLALGAGLAHAAEQTILGSALMVKNPSTPEKRKVVVKAKEPGSPNTLIGNPVALGGVLQVTASGAATSSQSFILPQGTSITGKPFWSGDPIKGYKYKDARGENGPVKTLKIKRSAGGVFTVKAVVVGKLGPVLVVPPNPGTSGCVRVQLQAGDTYAIEFGPTSRITNKGGTLFKAKKPAVEGNCGAPVPTTSTTTTTATTSSTTTTTLYGSPSRAFLDRIGGLLD